MAFKFSKQDIKDRDEVVKALTLRRENLNDAIEAYNQALGKEWESIEQALEDYNGAVADAREFVERVKSEHEDAFNEKSEKWQEGDKGSAAREWIDSFDSIELDEVELEAPEVLDQVSSDGADTLENMDTEAAA